MERQERGQDLIINKEFGFDPTEGASTHPISIHGYDDGIVNELARHIRARLDELWGIQVVVKVEVLDSP